MLLSVVNFSVTSYRILLGNEQFPWRLSSDSMMERQDQKLEESFAALKEYFTPSRQSESSSNPAQLVLFAEHAIKVGVTKFLIGAYHF